jgi:hypothetical protein
LSGSEPIHDRHVTIHQNNLNWTRFILLMQLNVFYYSLFSIVCFYHIIFHIYLYHLLHHIFYDLYVEKAVIDYHYARTNFLLLLKLSLNIKNAFLLLKMSIWNYFTCVSLHHKLFLIMSILLNKLFLILNLLFILRVNHIRISWNFNESLLFNISDLFVLWYNRIRNSIKIILHL